MVAAEVLLEVVVFQEVDFRPVVVPAMVAVAAEAVANRRLVICKW